MSIKVCQSILHVSVSANITCDAMQVTPYRAKLYDAAAQRKIHAEACANLNLHF